MSRTATTLKFKMCLFLEESCSWAEKLFTEINLLHLIPNDGNNFDGSLIFNFRNDDVTCSTRYTLF